jgi:hypothetical protein
MQAFVLLLMAVVMLAPDAANFGAPSFLGYLPEVMSAVALPYVLLEGSRRGFRGVAAKYWLTFSAVALVAVLGLFVTGPRSIPLINGLRFYLRAMPFFLIPAIYDFSETEIRQQLYLLLWLGLLQFPVSIYQRWIVLSQGRFSGDTVQGTLLDSGIESIYLICAALILTSMYVRGYVEKKRYFLLLFLLMFPTCINETKVTVFYVPVGFTIALLIATERTKRLRTLGGLFALLLGFAAIFIPVYNLMEVNSPYKNGKNIISFFSNEREIDRYMSSDVKGITKSKNVRRGDAITVPLKMLTQDPVHLMLGFGVGSTAAATLGGDSEGSYHSMFKEFLETSFTSFVLEIGMLGVCLIMLLYWLIFRDSLVVSHQPGLIGAIASGWTAVTVLLCVSLFYSNVHVSSCLSYLFWYFSGLVAAHRARMTQPATSTAAASTVDTRMDIARSRGRRIPQIDPGIRIR